MPVINAPAVNPWRNGVAEIVRASTRGGRRKTLETGSAISIVTASSTGTLSNVIIAGNELLDEAGQGDAESIGATAAMCDGAVIEAGEVLGLGDLEGWVSVSDGMALYCLRDGNDLVGCVGGGSRTALGHMARLLDQKKKGGM